MSIQDLKLCIRHSHMLPFRTRAVHPTEPFQLSNPQFAANEGLLFRSGQNPSQTTQRQRNARHNLCFTVAVTCLERTAASILCTWDSNAVDCSVTNAIYITTRLRARRQVRQLAFNWWLRDLNCDSVRSNLVHSLFRLNLRKHQLVAELQGRQTDCAALGLPPRGDQE